LESIRPFRNGEEITCPLANLGRVSFGIHSIAQGLWACSYSLASCGAPKFLILRFSRPWDRLNCCGNTPVSGQNRPWVWNGTFPMEQFLTLTHLDHFYVSHTVNFIYDMFSNRTLALPELHLFQIDGGSTRLALPDRWPAQLENVFVNQILHMILSRLFPRSSPSVPLHSHFSQARLYGHGAGQLPPLLDSAGSSQLIELYASYPNLLFCFRN
jgi:hypothetical protein